MKKILCILFFALTTYIFADDYHAEDFLKKEWESFSSKHPSLTKYSSEEIASLANQYGKKAAKVQSVSETIREVDPKIVEKLIVLLKEDEPKIFMRHGEQQKSEQTKRLATDLQKIEMMRLPDNLENSLTKTSVAEWVEGMIIWEYLREKTGRNVVVESSKNRRAELPAMALAYALKTDLNFTENLNCVNYPSNEKLSTSELLKWLPDGTLPWEKEKVDAVIGANTYEHITQEMKKHLSSVSRADTLFINITHTQQINAVSALSGLPTSRLGNFGFIVCSGKYKEVFPEGFYKKKTD